MASATSLPRVDDRIRVLVADSTRMGSQLLSDALKRSGRFDVTGSAANSVELLSGLAEGKPQVVVLSPNLDEEEGKGFTLTRQLRSSHHKDRDSDRFLVAGSGGGGFSRGGQGRFLQGEFHQRPMQMH